MRFHIHVDADWKVTVTWGKKDIESRYERGTLRRLPKTKADGERGQFPLPPEDELLTLDESLDDLSKSTQVRPLWEAYQRIAKRAPAKGDVSEFGRYLFNTLIGASLWNQIILAAQAENAQVIELALSWAAGEIFLHRLNWEMMYGPHGFLSSGLPPGVGPHLVTITHLAEQKLAQPGPPPIPPQIEAPPRILFVIGAPLNDPNIRPGAEFLGLLRQLRSKQRSFHSLIVRGADSEHGATPRQLREAIQTFRPDVVHFICHGNVDSATNRSYLELDLDPEETDKRRFGDHLMGYLSVGPVPPVVVMAACDSATGNLLSTEKSSPLAAELVQRGIPVVIGMAGRVSDRACRLFTRQFGTALIEGKPLVTATALGRWSAFYEGPLPEKSVDWAFPTLFMAAYIPEDYAPVKVEAHDRGWVIEERIRAYNLPDEPVFCGRDEFFQAYYDLFRPSQPKVLLIYTKQETKGLGRTRLLQELTAQAIRDGHIPCLVSPPSDDAASLLPTHAGQLGIELLKAINAARTVYCLAPPVDSVFLEQVQTLQPDPSLQALKNVLAKQPATLFGNIIGRYAGLAKDVVPGDAVKPAVQEDLARLIADARREYSPKDGATYPVIGKSSHVLVLLDAIDQYGAELQAVLLRNMLGAVGSVGFGDTKEPVPVVMTCSLPRAIDDIKEYVSGARTTPPWLKIFELTPFPPNGEDLLAYERVLLNPGEKRKKMLEGVSDKAWAVNDRAEADKVKLAQNAFRLLLKGMPILMAEGDTLFATVAAISGYGYLLLADDEDVFKKWGDPTVRAGE